MLVLTRRKGDGITINGEITIKVLRVSERKVILGFDAPPHVNIHRDDMKKVSGAIARDRVAGEGPLGIRMKARPQGSGDSVR